uniref:Uncharacterized protein n=1 Tax=Cannabis sativa TaxID=3483 RepID=A0A803P0G6_CANSA
MISILAGFSNQRIVFFWRFRGLWEWLAQVGKVRGESFGFVLVSRRGMLVGKGRWQYFELVDLELLELWEVFDRVKVIVFTVCCSLMLLMMALSRAVKVGGEFNGVGLRPTSWDCSEATGGSVGSCGGIEGMVLGSETQTLLVRFDVMKVATEGWQSLSVLDKTVED